MAFPVDKIIKIKNPMDTHTEIDKKIKMFENGTLEFR